jgi:hypothetical protein
LLALVRMVGQKLLQRTIIRKIAEEKHKAGENELLKLLGRQIFLSNNISVKKRAVLYTVRQTTALRTTIQEKNSTRITML